MIRRALLAGVLMLAAALAASVSPALAAPFLSIESPGSGTVTNEANPTISGFASDSEDPVSVVVSKGGFTYESANPEPKSDGSWSVHLSTDLEEGEYAVVAQQAEALTGETAEAGPVGFAVDFQSPSVTLNGVPSPTSDSTPSFSGTASDTTEVTVYVHRGSSTGGSLAAEVTAGVSGGTWSTEPVGSLGDGTYTAVAEQPSSIGNPRASANRARSSSTRRNRR